MVFSVFKKSLDFHGCYQRLLSQNRAHRVHWHSTTMSQAPPFLSPTPSQTIDLKTLPRPDLHSPLIWPVSSLFSTPGLWPQVLLLACSLTCTFPVSKPSPYGPNSPFSHALTNFAWLEVNLDIRISTTSHRISHPQTVARRRTALRPSGSFEPADSCWSLSYSLKSEELSFS